MNNRQSVQEQASQAKAPTSKQESTKSQNQHVDSGNFVIQLVARRPWLFLIGLSGVFLVGAVVALYSLGYVGFVPQTKPEEEEALQAEIVESTDTPSEATNPIPFWMVAAIALSCASGCLMIFRFLNPSPQPQRVEKRINRQTSRLHQRPHPKLQSHPQQPEAVVMETSTETKPVVTVLPPEPSFAGGQDKNKESLASMLDIRKRTSLSAILRQD